MGQGLPRRSTSSSTSPDQERIYARLDPETSLGLAGCLEGGRDLGDVAANAVVGNWRSYVVRSQFQDSTPIG
jgi:hypothetical protein